MGGRSAVLALLAAAGLAAIVAFAPEPRADSAEALERLGRSLPVWTGLPFAGMLLSIALFPLLAPGFWHRNFKKVAVAWAIVFFAPFLLEYGSLAIVKLLEVLLVDYVPFLILLWGLYTVSGGILLLATLVGTPPRSSRRPRASRR